MWHARIGSGVAGVTHNGTADPQPRRSVPYYKYMHFGPTVKATYVYEY